MLEDILAIVAIILFFVIPYFIFYLRGITLKGILPLLSIGLIIMLSILPDEYDLIGGITIILWCYLVCIGIWKAFSYRLGFAKVIRRCMIEPSNRDIIKLGKYIKNRRITYKWAKKRMPKAVIELMKIHQRLIKSNNCDPQLVDVYLNNIMKSGFIEASESDSLISTLS